VEPVGVDETGSRGSPGRQGRTCEQAWAWIHPLVDATIMEHKPHATGQWLEPSTVQKYY